MFLPINLDKLTISAAYKGKVKYLLLLVLSGLIFTTKTQALAHTVKISADVGATVHLEPNDNPRAGEVTQAWFALTRKGGKVIPLKDCNCRLAIYAEPHVAGEPALIEPRLKSLQVERYEGIPGAEITFPKPGAYQLQLTGKPVTEGSFKPFDLKFVVTVATGKAVDIPQPGQNVHENQQGTTIGLAQPLIGLGVLLISGGIIVFLRQIK
ncbi:FixH family protein [Dolichospermum sp. ST_con]|nr:FixH family protein [Dolichospermum sp. ST_con]MDD1422254.1 FixH family protein [Dolichospermum sp. ST_sed1]MDD1428158.1 FixH family protein [Dolichospermum sp. ST_sed9]MDD1434251.1 FixH family protein [Dolichospermum sp. ST_sed6]MDD1443589.1 FixH family protein [Dolichospermum sp. ST_sed3]MDD1449213.1 FixH family protein [Dolichospermum sp. ST_sed8]MDD1457896.1 FixH family protein [Dolichospermum sp. ST_sed7]MDD1463285.1 FixH family protein [Dolichospermum sp. ST_sed2]MDD1468485.1 FixH 